MFGALFPLISKFGGNLCRVDISKLSHGGYVYSIVFEGDPKRTEGPHWNHSEINWDSGGGLLKLTTLSLTAY